MLSRTLYSQKDESEEYSRSLFSEQKHNRKEVSTDPNLERDILKLETNEKVPKKYNNIIVKQIIFFRNATKRNSF